ncbi:YlmH/Sll1252 family protein [Apilactobacillus sp. TMW 2.2459]|uniref:YlmH family RNA-binding protein n=1 Tax=Apilactobacillus xinyiensis TaxID=2841032 RepID=UPI00200FD70D|nr:YlmH/Sll1252 family protein [Apilactobacillus xinyiensis]MCL0312413.1 YlmH/Sll1252 family protein [Apilactobacillus xinyiensis]
MNNDKIIQHFRKNEIPFIDYINDIVQKASIQYRPILTNFINPRQNYILKTIVNSYEDLSFKSYGGFEDAEMLRTLVYPKYYEPKKNDFEIELCEIKYPEKFANIKHNQILGSLMSLGINRDVVGDIISDGTRWQFLCSKSISSYICLNLNKIDKINVQVNKIDFNLELKHKINTNRNIFCTTTSLRIDNLISNVFNMPRKNSKDLIIHGLVHFNWELVNKPNLDASLYDMVSVRGYGRFKIISFDGYTKKSRMKLNILIIRNK